MTHNNIVFVLFSGSFSSPIRWEYAFEGKPTLRKITFLKELKNIGDIYSFHYKHFNLNYYARSPDSKERNMWNKIIKKYNYYTPDIEFSIEDLDYKNLCENTYKNVKSKYGDDKKYIVMGHSYGGALALLFAKLYKNECILCCCLDNVPYVKSFFQKYDKRENKDILQKFTSNQELHKSLDIVKHTQDKDIKDKEIGDLFKFIMYKSAQDRIKYFDNKLYVPTIFFKKYDEQLERNANNKKEKKHFEKDKLFRGYFVMKKVGHYIWENQEFSNIIIKAIKDNVNTSYSLSNSSNLNNKTQKSKRKNKSKSKSKKLTKKK